MAEKVAVVALWHGAELVMEERWIDTDDGRQETRYAFPGGSIEPEEEVLDAAIREVYEETGIMLDRNKITGPDVLNAGEYEGHMFQAHVPYNASLKDGSIVVWTRQDLDDHKERGKLMPLTNEYVERFF